LGPISPIAFLCDPDAFARLQQKKSSWVRLQVPRGIGAVQTFSGRHLNVGEDGTVDVSAEDAEYFIRDGWTKLAEWESVEDA
jgi:hypothetical protein